MTRRWLRVTGAAAMAIALVVGLWCALAWWVLPPWIQAQAEARLGSVFGRATKVAAVRIAPWPLAIEVQGVEVAARDAGRPPLLHIERLHALTSAASITQRAWVIDEIGVDGLRITLERTGRTQTDIDDLVQSALAPRPASPTDEPLPRVVVRRFDLRDSAVAVDDRTAGRRHAIDALAISVSDVSTRPEDGANAWQAKLALRLNGSAMHAQAEGTPLAADRRFAWRSTVESLDVAAFRADIDTLLPLRLQSARFSATVDGHFAQHDARAATIELRGQASLADLNLRYADGSAAVQARAAGVQIGKLRPLERLIEIDRVSVDGVVLPLVRAGDGRLNLETLTHAKPDTPAPTSPAWTLALRELQLDDATISWRDLGVAPAAALTVADLSLRASDIHLPPGPAVALRAQARLRAADGAPSGRFGIDGTAAAQAAKLTVSVDDFDLRVLQPYLGAWLVPRIEQGRLRAQGRIDWSAGSAGSLRLAFDEARVDKLAIGDAGWRSLAALGLELDLGTRELRLGELRVDQPKLRLARDAQGRVNLAAWLRAPAGAATAAVDARKPHVPAASPWRLQADRIVVAGGRLELADALPARPGADDPLALRIDGLALRTGALRWPPGPTPISLGLRGQIVLPADPATTDRRFTMRGELGLVPLTWKGRVELAGAPLFAFARYAPLPPDQRVLGADAGLRARVELAQTAAGWRALVDGDASLSDLRIAEQGAADGDLLSWRALDANGLHLQLVPGKTRRVAIGELRLTGLDSSLVVTEQGELKLATVNAQADQPEPGQPAAAASAPAAAPGDEIDVEIGSTHLVDGKIDFEDHFIRPNYRAELTALNGQLGTVRSSGGDPAPLVLGGTVAGTGKVEISGSINPIARPLALNLRARARGIELPPLSAYSGKYAGYGITEGTLSVDVSYRIDADGKLDAKNRIVLDRLSFGDPVESPSATKLPVRFLVALLKDRNGVIDLNLPIEGSINQPEFRLGPLIIEVLVKLLTRAVASPFAAIAGEDGDKLGALGFVAGTAAFDADAAKVFERVAAVLESRPGLTLDIVGTADPASEAEAFRQAALDARLAALQPESGSEPPTDEQRHARLRQMYRQTDLPDRPRNLIGRLADVPDAEMAARLRAAIPVTADAMRNLAHERGLAVRSALMARGVASERLFVGTPVLRGADDTGWTPRARLSLIAP